LSIFIEQLKKQHQEQLSMLADCPAEDRAFYGNKLTIRHAQALLEYQILSDSDKSYLNRQTDLYLQREALRKYRSTTASAEFKQACVKAEQAVFEEVPEPTRLAKPLDDQLKYQARPLPNIIALGFLPWLVQQFVKSCGF
jgi:hypothetical protein